MGADDSRADGDERIGPYKPFVRQPGNSGEQSSQAIHGCGLDEPRVPKSELIVEVLTRTGTPIPACLPPILNKAGYPIQTAVAAATGWDTPNLTSEQCHLERKPPQRP
jgi:hypothetical protein